MNGWQKARALLDQELLLGTFFAPAVAGILSVLAAYLFVDSSLVTSLGVGVAAMLVIYLVLRLRFRVR